MAVAKPATRTVPAGSPDGSRSAAPHRQRRGSSSRGRRAVPRRGQPHPPADGLDQRGPRLAGQNGELLGDGGGGDVELLGDLAHRPEPRHVEQHLQPTKIHRSIVHHAVNDTSMNLT